MTIGKALKKIRKKLGITQTEMAANVISTAFYSKVERDEYDLDTMKLIKILTIHHIDPIKFMQQIVTFDHDDNNDYRHDVLHKKILAAYYNQDLNQIKKINNFCKIHNIKDLYFQSIFLEAAINRDTKLIPIDIKEKSKKYLFERNNWDEGFIEILTNSLLALNFEDIILLIHAIITKYSEINELSDKMVILLSSLNINFLSLVYFHHSQTNVREEAINFLRSLPEKPENCFAKIMANYYEAVFSGNQSKKKSILTFMRKNDLNSLAKNIDLEGDK